MKILKPVKKLFIKAFRSIDTITTKLLLLVLCCVTIPLIVVANFSTAVINQSIIENAEARLEISKNIFLKKYYDELNTLSNYKDSRDIFKNNEDLSFIFLLDSDKNVKKAFGNIETGLVVEKLKKLIKLASAEEPVLLTENIDDKLYQIIINPVSDETASVVIAGRLLDEKKIESFLNKTTGAKVKIFSQNNEIEQQKNENDLTSVLPLKNFFNEPVGYVYLSFSTQDFIGLINQNYWLISFIAIISLLVAIIIAALFARKITDPILALSEAAESINLGDLDYKLEIRGNDETAKLCNSFNKMVSNLEKEERLRNNFVATLTHDLKVPMLAENQTVSFLLNETYGPLTKEQKEVLELIKSTNSSSLEMIGTLLEVYRYDSGNAALYETEFNLVELMHESVQQIKSLSLDKKIDLNIIPSHENIMIKADQRDIKRVIHNLVSNAIYHGIYRGFVNCKMEMISGNIIYNPVSTAENYTTLKKPLEISGSVLISIEDNGVGIAREDMAHLFKRFSLSKGRKPSGSGLGLYYSHQVITLHKGTIWAESSEKGGSSIKFTLPLNL